MWKENYLNIKGNMLYSAIKDNRYKGMVYKFIMNDIAVCRIYKTKGSEVFRGTVYNKEGSQHEEFIYDKNLDIVKLKCLVLAKELGWKVKNVI